MKTLKKNRLTLTTAADAPAQPLPVGDAYADFLRAKVRLAVDAGFDATDIEVNPLVKEHQRDIIKYAIRGGRRAIFNGRASCREECTRHHQVRYSRWTPGNLQRKSVV